MPVPRRLRASCCRARRFPLRGGSRRWRLVSRPSPTAPAKRKVTRTTRMSAVRKQDDRKKGPRYNRPRGRRKQKARDVETLGLWTLGTRDANRRTHAFGRLLFRGRRKRSDTEKGGEGVPGERRPKQAQRKKRSISLRKRRNKSGGNLLSSVTLLSLPCTHSDRKGSPDKRGAAVE